MTEIQTPVDKEQQFLLSRQARTSASDRSQQVRQHSEELHAFWTVLRSKLSIWEVSLDQLEEKQPQGIIRQELEDLKEELQQLRKHCLASTVCFDDWEVPDLPVADLRLLHTEFTKYSTKWETTKDRLVPKGKFVFRRYREELAKRKANGIPLDGPSRQSNPSTKPAPTSSLGNPNGSCVQGISNASITIDANGDVQVIGAATTTVVQISASALLVRNLQDCTLTIEKPLQALHVVQSSKTTIRVTEPVSSAIHVTDCHDCSVHAKAQQLRLHESTDLKCHVDLVAGAILEDCTRLLFVSNNVDVKDFNWLRTGIPSPNFRIEPLIVTKKESGELPSNNCNASAPRETSALSDVPGESVIKADPMPKAPTPSRGEEKHNLNTASQSDNEDDDDDDEL